MSLLAKQGKDIPALNDEPEIDVVTGWYLQAFSRLRKSCTNERISLSEIESYINLFGSVGSRSEFVDLIQDMDIVFTEHAKNG